LGKNDQVDLPLLAIWFATGNNVQVAADTTRRLIHIRLDCLQERPEDRSEFRHANLLDWIAKNRGKLVSAGLTILSAYIKAGCPRTDIKPLGSFEGWSALPRQAVVWLGLPDPCLTRISLAESADTVADALGQMIEAFKAYDPTGQGVVAADLVRTLYPANRDHSHASGP
jgi:hypothetical protein